MRWTATVLPAKRPLRRLLAFPHAGGWSTSFRGWVSAVPDDLEVVVAQLPGRERRLSEANATSFQQIVDGVLSDLSKDTVPLTVIGHSFGAMVAYEATRALRALGTPVQLLVVSGKQPPCFPSFPPYASEASDEDLMARLVDMGGISRGMRDRPALLAPFLQAIRADLRLMERYERPRQACDVPILTVHAVDDPVVSGDRLGLWGIETTAGLESIQIEGDHFGIYDAKQFRRVVRCLDSLQGHGS